MELILNLAWLVLVVPAIFIGRRVSKSGSALGNLSQSRAPVLLGCLLVLLFPVVSATDDLYTQQADIEEACPAKRVIQAAAENKSCGMHMDSSSCARILTDRSIDPEFRLCGKIAESSPSNTAAVAGTIVGCRPPPAS